MAQWIEQTLKPTDRFSITVGDSYLCFKTTNASEPWEHDGYVAIEFVDHCAAEDLKRIAMALRIAAKKLEAMGSDSGLVERVK